MCRFGNKERLNFGDLLRVFLWLYISQTLRWLSDAPLFRNDGRQTLWDFSIHMACGIAVGWQKQSIRRCVWTLSNAKIFDRFPRILNVCFVSTLSLSQWPELVFQHNKFFSSKSDYLREAASHWLEDCKQFSLQNHDEAHHFIPRGWMSPCQNKSCYVFTLSLSQWPEVVFQHNKLLSSKSGEADHLLPTTWKLSVF